MTSFEYFTLKIDTFCLAKVNTFIFNESTKSKGIYKLNNPCRKNYICIYSMHMNLKYTWLNFLMNIEQAQKNILIESGIKMTKSWICQFIFCDVKLSIIWKFPEPKSAPIESYIYK